MDLQTKKIANMGILLAFAVALSYIEHLIPIHLVVPGAKLGLANLLVLMLLFGESFKISDAVLFNLARILLVSFLFTNLFSLIYSLAGAACSLLAMIFAKEKLHFQVVTVSMVGGVFHNIGQIFVAMCLISEYSIFYYLPFLLISGLMAGVLIGVLCKILLKRRLL